MLKQYLINRVHEASTWIGLFQFIEAAIGVSTSASFNTSAANVALAIVGLAGVAVKETWFTGVVAHISGASVSK